MARSTYYYHTKRLGEPDGHEDDRQHIAAIYERNRGLYGYRRITAQLRNEGREINHKTVQKLMRQMKLKGRRKSGAKYKSFKGEIGKVAPNVLNRDFSATAPNQKWATDVTEIKIHDKKLYLSPIIDLYNSEIITYTLSEHPNLEQVVKMLKQAFAKVPNTDKLVFHSDQGWQYQHQYYQHLLKENNIVQSMSRKGNCLDNAVMENFFGIMKNELLYLHQWNDIYQFQDELKDYIDYYNNDRIKLRLNGKSPVQYRASSNQRVA